MSPGRKRWRILVGMSGAVLLGLGFWRLARPAASRYNLVLVSLDTLRQDRLNTYGYERRKVSPHLDALAAESVVFENAIAASPWTTPSHLSLLTSLSPSSHGVMASFHDTLQQVREKNVVGRLPESRTTLAEVLFRHGHATAAFTGGATLDPSLGFSQGFAFYDTSMSKLEDGNMPRMKDWIDSHRSEPFFLFWHTFETHGPYLDTTFLAEAVPRETGERVRALVSELGQHLRRGGLMPEAEARISEFERFNGEISGALYDGGILSADRRVGELVAHLRRQGLYDRTLLIVTSDHGEELGDREPPGFNGSHGHTLYEEMVVVPLIVKLPGQAHAGKRVTAVARGIDVMPTVLEVLGLPRDAPWRAAPCAPCGREGRRTAGSPSARPWPSRTRRRACAPTVTS